MSQDTKLKYILELLKTGDGVEQATKELQKFLADSKASHEEIAKSAKENRAKELNDFRSMIQVMRDFRSTQVASEKQQFAEISRAIQEQAKLEKAVNDGRMQSEKALQSERSKSTSFAGIGFSGGGAGVAASEISSLASAASAAIPIVAGLFSVKKIGDFALAAGEARIQFEGFYNIFKSLTGSDAGAGGEIAFLRAEADRLGVSFAATAPLIARYESAAQAAGQSTEFMHRTISTLSGASRALNLDASTTASVFLAVEQMISKGTVSMQEMRLQLGNALPGAMGIASRAMGVTTGELMKMVETGKLATEDFLPRFIEQLSKEIPPGAAVMSLGAEMERLKNASFDLKVSLGNMFDGKILSAATEYLKLLTNMNEQMSKHGMIGLAKGDKAGFFMDAVKAYFSAIIPGQSGLLDKPQQRDNPEDVAALYSKMREYKNTSGMSGEKRDFLLSQMDDALQSPNAMDRLRRIAQELLPGAGIAAVAAIQKAAQPLTDKQIKDSEAAGEMLTRMTLAGMEEGLDKVEKKVEDARRKRQDEISTFDVSPDAKGFLMDRSELEYIAELKKARADYRKKEAEDAEKSEEQSRKEFEQSLKQIDEENKALEERNALRKKNADAYAVAQDNDYQRQMQLRDRLTLESLTGEAQIQEAERQRYTNVAAYIQDSISLTEEQKAQMIALNELIHDHASETSRMLVQIGDYAKNNFAHGFTQAFSEFVRGSKSAGEAFRDFASTFLDQVAQMILSMAILKAISGIAGAIGGGTDTAYTSAGASFAEGGIAPRLFAGGGVAMANTATFVPHYNAVYGEAGPELAAFITRPRKFADGGITGMMQGRPVTLTQGSPGSQSGSVNGVITIMIKRDAGTDALVKEAAIEGASLRILNDINEESSIRRAIQGLSKV